MAALMGMAVAAQQALNNDAIVKMVKAGLGEETVVSMINAQPGNYAVDPDSLIQLKSAGVTDKEIAAMVGRESAEATPASGVSGVDEVGIYYKNKDNKWIEMQPEVVNWKSGGFMKSLASDGIVKGDINGHLQGKTSPLSLNTPLDFAIDMPEGTAPTEYELLKLHTSGNSREFRSMTGGVIHSSGGAQRDEVDFKYNKIAPHIYEITLSGDVKSGEYGFMPPGSMSSSNLASSGKIYTFHVIE